MSKIELDEWQNSIDPDQKLCSAASDLVLHSLLRLSVPILRVIMVIITLTIETDKLEQTE